MGKSAIFLNFIQPSTALGQAFKRSKPNPGRISTVRCEFKYRCMFLKIGTKILTIFMVF